jgi:hypothetical protein
MDKKNKSKNGLFTIIGIISGILLFFRGNKRRTFSEKMGELAPEGSEERADQNLRLNAARIFAKRLDLPLDQVLQVLIKPESNPQLLKKLQSELNKSEVMFSIKSKSEITVSLEMQWHDGTKTTGRQTWKNSEVPRHILSELKETQEPILVNWVLDD